MALCYPGRPTSLLISRPRAWSTRSLPNALWRGRLSSCSQSSQRWSKVAIQPEWPEVLREVRVRRELPDLRVGPAWRIDYRPPAVVKCGPCPVRRLCLSLTWWRGCVPGSRSRRPRTPGCGRPRGSRRGRRLAAGGRAGAGRCADCASGCAGWAGGGVAAAAG
jgi:hypothetical protein